MNITQDIHRVSVSGEELYVRQLTPEGVNDCLPTLILLHEALGSVALWRDFPEALVEETGLPALMYDRCGFGESQPLISPRQGEYLEQEVDCLRGLLEGFDIEHPLLVGHSDGGTLALLYAASYPDAVSAVICEAAHLFVEEITLDGIRKTVARWENSDLRQKLERYHGSKAESIFRLWVNTWLDPDFHDWNIEELMPRICCPVLALQGENDEFGTDRQLNAISSGISGTTRTRLLKSCGHVPHHQARHDVLAEMKSFALEVGAEFEKVV